ncbi:MAG: peptidoglycan DD-metalloendopeptidase family protein [Gammaproteobacteria bacterium]|nr:peptidoglycan DD-metalloendopeptidase family protein [Gammaproteobacteria bacterium]
MRLFRFLIGVFVAISLAACATEAAIEPIPKSGMHRVKKGETLYSIAWRFGVDYRKLAKRNGLTRPYHLHKGQVIYFRGKSQRTGLVSKTESIDREPTASVANWHWPAQGAVRGVYSAANKGTNIAGFLGQPIFAAAAGKVVYSGHGLRDYGNLIIIKHNDTFLTAYAYANAVLVTNGEWVKAGQKIAEMGETNTHKVILHFEIRRNGEPVNPLFYLPKNG